MQVTEPIQQDDEKLLNAKSRLLRRIRYGGASPAKVSKLKLKDIKSLPSVFQHRTNNLAASESHIRELVKCLTRHPEQPFSPLVVYWIGDSWCVIDGHHRLEAYQTMKFKAAIPVTVFSGSLDAAILLSLSSNAKDKLAMSAQEKSNAAWRLVISTENSRSMIAKGAGVSERTVSYMKAVMKRLSEQHPEKALDDLSWIDAMKLDQGKSTDTHTGSADWVETEAQELASRFAKQFGRRLSQNYEVTMRALEIYDNRIPSAIADFYSSPEDVLEDKPITRISDDEEF